MTIFSASQFFYRILYKSKNEYFQEITEQESVKEKPKEKPEEKKKPKEVHMSAIFNTKFFLDFPSFNALTQ